MLQVYCAVEEPTLRQAPGRRLTAARRATTWAADRAIESGAEVIAVTAIDVDMQFVRDAVLALNWGCGQGARSHRDTGEDGLSGYGRCRTCCLVSLTTTSATVEIWCGSWGRGTSGPRPRTAVGPDKIKPCTYGQALSPSGCGPGSSSSRCSRSSAPLRSGSRRGPGDRRPETGTGGRSRRPVPHRPGRVARRQRRHRHRVQRRHPGRHRRAHQHRRPRDRLPHRRLIRGPGALPFHAGEVNREMVLGNAVVFGSVNANRRHYDTAGGRSPRRRPALAEPGSSPSGYRSPPSPMRSKSGPGM